MESKIQELFRLIALSSHFRKKGLGSFIIQLADLPDLPYKPYKQFAYRVKANESEDIAIERAKSVILKVPSINE
jgi:hypothetical protein